MDRVTGIDTKPPNAGLVHELTLESPQFLNRVG